MARLAQEIAQSARERLLTRARSACADLAGGPADLLGLDAERIDVAALSAIAQVDELGWRRSVALAGADRLSIGVADAHRHPAVIRAAEIVATQPRTAPVALRAADPDPGGDGANPPAANTATDVESEPGNPGAALEADDLAAAGDTGDGSLTLSVIHLEGVIDLPASRRIDLRLSADGLEILRGPDAVFGRLPWLEIDDLFVGPPRGRFTRTAARTLLVMRTADGEATFEVPELSPAELRERVEPITSRFLAG